jgi:hypothetical protein
MKKITLSVPIKGHREFISEIELREPKYADFIALGVPVTWVSLAEGGGFSSESAALIGEWIERLSNVEPALLTTDYLRYGTPVAPSEAQRGDILVEGRH